MDAEEAVHGPHRGCVRRSQADETKGSSLPFSFFHMSNCLKPAITSFLALQVVASPHKRVSLLPTSKKSLTLACWRFSECWLVAAFLAGSSSTAGVGLGLGGQKVFFDVPTLI